MEVAFTKWVRITDSTSVGEVRRAGQRAAEELGLDEVKAGELALLITEVTRNALIHGGGGQAIILGSRDGYGPNVLVLTLDNGPGITNVARAMHDGFSTAGTMGGGLGAIQRIASNFEIFTARSGTIILLEVGVVPPQRQDIGIAGMALPYPGETVCGDAWAFHREPGRVLVTVVDGLGHGAGAAEASQDAIATFRKRSSESPGAILKYMHEALKKTRGAVGAIAEIRSTTNTLTYAGVGNAVAVLLSKGSSKNLVSHNGTLGMTIPRLQEFCVEWPADGVLVMHSDGIQSRWDLSGYPGLMARHPALIGGALIRDFRRHRDDATVVVMKAIA